MQYHCCQMIEYTFVWCLPYSLRTIDERGNCITKSELPGNHMLSFFCWLLNSSGHERESGSIVCWFINPSLEDNGPDITRSVIDGFCFKSYQSKITWDALLCVFQASGVTDEQLAEVRQAFKRFDKNKANAICAKELGSMMKSLGQSVTENDIRTMINHADLNST